VPELDLGGHGPILVATDHALDALVAALVARAHASGQTRPPNHDETALAVTEGWIWLPDRPIGELTETRGSRGWRTGRPSSGPEKTTALGEPRTRGSCRTPPTSGTQGGSSTRVLSDADMLEWYVT
jgi:hypothetical protein